MDYKPQRMLVDFCSVTGRNTNRSVKVTAFELSTFTKSSMSTGPLLIPHFTVREFFHPYLYCKIMLYIPFVDVNVTCISFLSLQMFIIFNYFSLIHFLRAALTVKCGGGGGFVLKQYKNTYTFPFK